jgi:hypothetical protein
MGRIKKSPDLENADLGINPFSVHLKIKVNRKVYKVIKNGLPDTDDVTLESNPFTKVFEVAGYKANMQTLTIRGKELLLYLIHSIDGKSDVIWIDRAKYMKINNIKSVNTFKDAIADAAKHGYIQAHTDSRRFKDVYWINPHYMFKGDRVRKYPHNHV